MILFANDPRYRQFLAIHAGIWGEVGELEDAVLFASLRRDRRKAGLPVDRWTPPDLSSPAAGAKMRIRARSLPRQLLPFGEGTPA